MKNIAARLIGAAALAVLGFVVMCGDGGPTAAGFAAYLALIGACFGGAIGLLAGKPILLSIIGTLLCLLFALWATH